MTTRPTCSICLSAIYGLNDEADSSIASSAGSASGVARVFVGLSHALAVEPGLRSKFLENGNIRSRG